MTEEIDIVEALRSWTDDDAWAFGRICKDASDTIEALRKQVEELKSDSSFLRNYAEEARFAALEDAAKLIEEGFARKGISKKQDMCAHGKYEWEDCEMCAVDAIRALKDGGRRQ